MNRIKFRRGSLDNKKNIDIEDGEPIYLTDTKRLYVSNEDVAINNVYVGSQEPNDPGINVWIDPQGVNNVIDMIYPIGSIYMSVNDADPATLFGGTWEQFAKGRTLVGVDTSQTEFNSVQKTGGSKYLQNHYHDIRYAGYYGDGVTISDTGSGVRVLNITSWNWTNNVANSFSGSGSNIYTNDVGGGNSENLQPYITVYIWKRTA